MKGICIYVKSNKDKSRGNRRKTMNIEECTGLDIKNGIIQFANSNIITLIGGSSGVGRSVRSNYITFKDENGDVVEMNMRDGSCRVIWTKEELEEG